MSATERVIDVDDTTECPVADRCATCNGVGDLAVGTAEAVGIGAGVFCLTLCSACVLEPLPTMAPLEALSRVCEHCDHLGIDLDLMSATLRGVTS